MSFVVSSRRKVHNDRESQKVFLLFWVFAWGPLLPPEKSITYFLATAEATNLVNIPVFSQKEASLFSFTTWWLLSHLCKVLVLSSQSWNYSTTLQHCPTSCRDIYLGFSFNYGSLRNQNLRRLLFTLTLYMLTWELCKIKK